MNAAFERLLQHLDEHDVRYRLHDDVGMVCADFQGEVGTYRVVASVDEEAGLFEVFGCSPIRVPEGARPAIAETIIRANYGLRMGKLEMDYADGKLRYQLACPLVDEELDDLVISRSFAAVLMTLDRYLPAILSVIYGNDLPQDAVRAAEQISSAERE